MRRYNEAPSQNWFLVDTVPFAALETNARTATYTAACSHKETHEREGHNEFATEQGWEQINDVAKLLESIDAMRKPKSRRSVAKFNPILEIRHSSTVEFQLSLKNGRGTDVEKH